MKLIYTFSDIGKGNNLKKREEAIKATDEGAEGMKEMIAIIAKMLGGGKLLIWFMTRHRRKLTKDYIEYDFYILRWVTKLSGKKVDELPKSKSVSEAKVNSSEAK